MTREEKKEELIGLFAVGAIFIGDLIDECFEFGQQHPCWISVEEEMPKDYQDVLAVVGENHFAFVGFCLNQTTWYCDIRNKAVEIKGITHWMPLPAPASASGKPTNCIIGTAEHIKIALDVMDKKGGEQ